MNASPSGQGNEHPTPHLTEGSDIDTAAPDWVARQRQAIHHKQRHAHVDPDVSVPLIDTAFRYWMSNGTTLFSPFFFGAEWTTNAAQSNCALGRCQTAPGPCGWCGITVVKNADTFARFLASRASIPRCTVGQGRFRVAGVVSTTTLNLTLPQSRWNDPTLAEYRVASARIERLHVAPANAGAVHQLSDRYGVEVAVGFSASALSRPLIQTAAT